MSTITDFLNAVGTPVYTSLCHIDIGDTNMDLLVRDSEFPTHDFTLEAEPSPTGKVMLTGIRFPREMTIDCIETHDFKVRKFVDKWLDDTIDKKTMRFRQDRTRANRDITITLYTFVDGDERDEIKIIQRYVKQEILSVLLSRGYTVPALASLTVKRDLNPILQQAFGIIRREGINATQSVMKAFNKVYPEGGDFIKNVTSIADKINAYTPINTSLTQFQGETEKFVGGKLDDFSRKISTIPYPTPVISPPNVQMIKEAVTDAVAKSTTEREFLIRNKKLKEKETMKLTYKNCVLTEAVSPIRIEHSAPDTYMSYTLSIFFEEIDLKLIN